MKLNSPAPVAVSAPLPDYAPIRRAGALGFNRQIEDGLLVGMNPTTSNGETTLDYIAHTIGAHGSKPRVIHGSLRASGLVGASPDRGSELDRGAFKTAVADVVAGMASVGREIPASTFDSAEGVRALLASLQPKDVVVQAVSDGKLATRVIDGNIDNPALEAAVGRVLG